MANIAFVLYSVQSSSPLRVLQHHLAHSISSHESLYYGDPDSQYQRRELNARQELLRCESLQENFPCWDVQLRVGVRRLYHVVLDQRQQVEGCDPYIPQLPGGLVRTHIAEEKDPGGNGPAADHGYDVGIYIQLPESWTYQ